MSLQVLVLFAVVAVALGSTVPSYNTPAPSYSAPAPSYRAPSPSYNAPAPSGAYYVLLPDGRGAEVAYTVNGDSWYVAEVTYEGEAQYPAHQPARLLLPAAPAPSTDQPLLPPTKPLLAMHKSAH
nr:DNA-directed RNA polymerase II subunit RPB1-like [Penaeus vannamei]